MQSKSNLLKQDMQSNIRLVNSPEMTSHEMQCEPNLLKHEMQSTIRLVNSPEMTSHEMQSKSNLLKHEMQSKWHVLRLRTTYTVIILNIVMRGLEHGPEIMRWLPWGAFVTTHHHLKNTCPKQALTGARQTH
jgi:hypothetical protein